MEPESSLPYSQAPATCPYPEANSIQSPQHPSHFLKIHLNIIQPSTSWSLQWSLSIRFPHQNLVHTSPFKFRIHTKEKPWLYTCIFICLIQCCYPSLFKIHALWKNLLTRLVVCLSPHSTHSTSIFTIKLKLYIFFTSFLSFWSLFICFNVP